MHIKWQVTNPMLFRFIRALCSSVETFPRARKMDTMKSLLLLCVLLLTYPKMAGGGPFCYYSCLGIIVVGTPVIGRAVVQLLGFTSSGIAAGSLAAWIMSQYGGAVPAGGWFANLQSIGATERTIKFALSSVSDWCHAICVPFP